MVRTVVIASVFVGAACVAIPPYEIASGVAWHDEPTTGGGIASGSNFTIHFAGAANGFHYPDSIRLNDAELIGHSNNAYCGSEDELGVALYPSGRISPHTLTSSGTNQIGGQLFGPAIAKAEIGWDDQLTCAERQPTGYSSFTVFPDGKIVRFDELDDSDGASAPASACHCGTLPTNDPWRVTSFYTIDPTMFTSYGAAMDPLPVGGPAGTVQCVAGPSGALAVAWPAATTRIASPTPSSTAFVYDFRVEGLDLGPLMSAQYSVTSAMFLGTTDCASLASRTADFLSNEQLTVDGGKIDIAVDGIYGGGASNTNLGITAGDRVVIEGPKSGSFAVRLSWDAAFDVPPRVTNSVGYTDAWYIPQRISDHEMLYWFRDPLLLSQTITIERR